ncbi:MAG TPA: bifunctional DNA primase/polymerase [Nitrospirota bacterium]|nr:bifunctional DNA primase/polymerase [Nitrospirota bacterium]
MNAATVLPTSFFDAANAYVAAGYSVIPVKGPAYARGSTDDEKKSDAKKPLIKWEIFQERKPINTEIKEWARKWPNANIAIVTGEVSNGLVVIDLDEVETAKQTLDTLIPDNLLFPIAISPSGGQHWYFRSSDQNIRNNCKVIPGADLRATGGYIVAPPSKGYTWQHGLSIFDVAVPALPQAVQDFLQLDSIELKYFRENGKSFIGTVDISVDMFAVGSRDNSLFHVANSLYKSGMPECEIFQVLRTLAKSWGEEHDAKWFNDKIRSAVKRKDRQEKALSEEVKEFVLSTKGGFLSTDVYAFLGLSTSVHNRQDKKNVSEILRRLCEQEVIERVGDKNGHFRVIDNTAEDIDFMSGDDTPIDLSWPFEIEQLVHTYQKSVIPVAGSSNSGKTAFLLNFVERNMRKHRINYFSSEMGKTELKSRLSKFGIPMDSWKKCAWRERSSNFADVIRKDDINIIDFLELHTDFFMVGQLIKDIFDRLHKGIAIIALQKNAGKEHGLGGERSIEKARLYLAMDTGKIKIVKGKNWAQDGKNPNRLERKFRLVQGCRFIPDSGWEKTEL